MLKRRIGLLVILVLLLIQLALPVAGAGDGKSLLKEMVQSPEDYSVNLGPVTEFRRLGFTPFWRVLTGDFYRLPFPCWDWKYGVGC